jgi:glucoamylase
LTIEGCTSEGGLLPEQVWDSDDIPERELFRGRPSGSAMPLVWAHAEYVKLVRSLRDGAIFDLPPQTVQRYLLEKTQPVCRDWREAWRRTKIPAGQGLRVEIPAPGTIRWTDDGWKNFRETPAEDAGLGIFAALLPTQSLPHGAAVTFTWRFADGSWRGQNYTVAIAG